MGKGVEKGEEDDTPGNGLVEGDGLVEGHDAVEGSRAQPGDEGPADGQEDDARVDVEDQGGSTGNWQGDSDDGARSLKVVRVEEIEEGESKQSDMDHDPQSEKDDSVSC